MLPFTKSTACSIAPVCGYPHPVPLTKQTCFIKDISMFCLSDERPHMVATHYNSKGPFHGRARYHSPSSLLIYSMESGDLRANYLSATRKVSHIQNSGHGPVVSSSPADILACCSHSYHFRTCPSRRSTAADARYTEASHRAGTPSEPLYLAATLRMTGPDAINFLPPWESGRL